MTSLKHFDAEAVQRVGMPAAIRMMREAFVQLSFGHALVPLRTVIEASEKKGIALFMPSYAPAWHLIGLKMVSVFPENKAPVPVIQGMMMVMDATNGMTVATLHAASVTALRTGAASGLATELLSAQDASTLAVYGTGVQALTQVAGILAVRNIKRILVKGTSRKKENAFCNRLAASYTVHCKPLEKPEELKDADVISTATTSVVPLFPRTALKPGVHINAVGAYKPHMRELGEDIIAQCRLVVDQREAALHEAGEIAIPIAEGKLSKDWIHAELGEIISKKKHGQTSTKEITVFKSVGNAIQDLAIAKYLLDSSGF